MLVGELLESFLEALAHPLSTFSLYFQFDFFEAGNGRCRRSSLLLGSGHKRRIGTRLDLFAPIIIAVSRCARPPTEPITPPVGQSAARHLPLFFAAGLA